MGMDDPTSNLNTDWSAVNGCFFLTFDWLFLVGDPKIGTLIAS